MLKHRWFAKAYGWHPDVVDNLWEDDDYWLPIIEDAWARVEALQRDNGSGG